jgi:hypothetical protein
MLPRARAATAIFVCLLLVMSCPLARAADESKGALTQATLDRALEKRLGDEDAARDTIRQLLEREDVQKLADGYGLDARRAAAAVGTLQGEELDRLAAQAAQVQSQLAGGDVVIIRISIVVLLLLIIIIILLAD